MKASITCFITFILCCGLIWRIFHTQSARGRYMIVLIKLLHAFILCFWLDLDDDRPDQSLTVRKLKSQGCKIL